MNKFLFFLFLLAATFCVYGGALKYGFSQDDWYFLSISQAQNFGDVLNFFNPALQSGFAFFRPLGTQLYYFLAPALLGLERSPVLMHILMLILQGSSAYLVYRLLTTLKYEDNLARFIALIYATTSTVFLSLYYIAATQQLLSTFFSLLSLLAFFQQKPLRVALYWALALLSKETAIMTPVLAVVLTMLPSLKFSPLKRWRDFLPYVLVGLGYIFLRTSVPLSVQSEYHFVFGTHALSTLRWFFLFGYGAPEEWLRYGLAGGALAWQGILRDYGLLGYLNLGSTLFLLIITLVSALRTVRTARFWLYLSWWFLGLAPILFLQNHRYPHYLDLSLIPLLLLTLEPLRRLRPLVLGVFLLASITAVMISTRSHWTLGRSVISARVISYFATHQVCDSSHLIFAAPAPYPAELGYALSLENGPRVICNNPALKVEYTENVRGGEGALILDPRQFF